MVNGGWRALPAPDSCLLNTEANGETENHLNINDTGKNVWDAPSSRKAIMRRVK
jgi:hypothetical protein